MVIDTSALVAIVFGEPDAETFLVAIGSADDPRLSAVTAVEAAIVVEARQGPEATNDLNLLIREAGIEVADCDREQVAAAVAAWRRFGKGRHPASLNFGECFSYALARTSGDPLLYKGNDFSQTDIAAAL
jgi:ribonuclease VapC